ncbi:MAG: SDR family NAD(P)-dependent oxidoreductase, partial [Candidatus Rokuibacteriota bacterium]
MNGFDLKGKVAIVTGGNGGIGLGMARWLAAAGASVAVAARDMAKSATAVK